MSNSKGKLKELEHREGRPIGDILIDLYAMHGSQIKIAEVLGVSQATISLWLLQAGLEQRVVLVPRAPRSFSQSIDSLPLFAEIENQQIERQTT